MSLNTYQTTRCYNPEDSILHSYHCENLKSNTLLNTYAIFLDQSVKDFTQVILKLKFSPVCTDSIMDKILFST
jgi:hypothetical protein